MSASTGERPFSAVLGSILGNLQDLVRSELRLVRTEVNEQLAAVSNGLGWAAVGVVSAIFALGFALWGAFCGLLRVLPDWASALVMAAALGIVTAISSLIYRAKRAAARKMALTSASVLKERMS
jgi:Na+-transporting NADH:ubiquinone oxidoreductase subunit NqrD